MQVINPAYTGIKNSGNLTAVNRTQWVGIDGAPQTQTVTLSIPFFNYNFGIGLNFINDKIGPISQTGLYIDYAYKLKFSKTRLSFGIKGGLNYLRYNLAGLRSTGSDSFLAGAERTNKLLPNFGIGLYYYSKQYYLGVSTPKILRNRYDEENTRARNSREERHYFVVGGLLLPLSENVLFKPSSIAKMVQNSPASVELNSTFIFMKKVWLGAFYRIGDSVGALAQFEVSKTLKIGYSYDMTHSRLRSYSGGTHEVLLSYNIFRNGGDILSPRYF
jgi:type IX secretion system PorP/SprF family membrane protein